MKEGESCPARLRIQPLWKVQAMGLAVLSRRTGEGQGEAQLVQPPLLEQLMKTGSSILLVAALFTFATGAQVLSVVAADMGATSAAVVDAGPHHRTWQVVTSQLDELGQLVTGTNFFTELQ